MRHLPLVVVIVLGSIQLRAAEAVPATQPAGTILVLPFVSPPGQSFDWIAKGVQQNLIAELSPDVRGAIVSPISAPATEDPAAARKAATDDHVSVVIFGSTQLLDRQIRLTGQVLDVASGNVLGTLKATGQLDELFRLEDTLAGQALRALPKTMLNLRGLAAQKGYGPQIIQLPPDTPASAPVYGNYSYAPVYVPQPYATLEPPAPPYSPYSYSYPYRFYYPYYHLFSYGNEGFFPFGFGFGRFDGHWRGETHRYGRR
jgi:TolB-like protein